MFAFESAIRKAEARARRENMTCLVYFAKGPDLWGRANVYYVRTVAEGVPGVECETVHTAKPVGEMWY